MWRRLARVRQTVRRSPAAEDGWTKLSSKLSLITYLLMCYRLLHRGRIRRGRLRSRTWRRRLARARQTVRRTPRGQGWRGVGGAPAAARPARARAAPPLDTLSAYPPLYRRASEPSHPTALARVRPY